MIIKGLFRKYKKWNPVHPTSGAFWGMGIGIGCGVGWGPGFGPEVVGYVGAGCGVGFSVGITFAGFGIGLPANVLIDGPYKAVAATTSYTWDLVRSSSLNRNVNHESGESELLNKGTERLNVQQSMSLCTKSISESFRSFRNQFSDKDDKE